jgi:hypothetical protein
MKIIERIHNTQTGEITDTERDETAAEAKARLDYEKQIAKELTEKQAKEAARQVVLDRLGITVEDLKVLGL